MLDPHNIPYDAIERDRKNGYHPGMNASSSSNSDRPFAIMLLGIIAGLILGGIFR